MKRPFFPPISVCASLLLVFALDTWSAAAHPASVPPTELVRQAVQNEINGQAAGASYMFRDRKQTPRGSQTKVMVETREAMAAVIIAINDKPLTTEQHEAEMKRVERFVKEPSELKKKQKQEKEDAERVTRIIKALPDAFLYEFGEPEVGNQEPGKPGRPLIRVNFTPKPDYDPPSHVEQVLRGMKGHLLIDERASRIARIDGTLVKDVGFGWGILGRLNHGGRFLVEQAQVGPGDWRITSLHLSFTGKILIFKSLNIHSTETYFDFRPVPADLTFAQGLDLLKRHDPVLAENQPRNGKGCAK